MTRVREWLVRVHREEDGTTLAELMVGLVVMAVFMTMFTGAIVMMTSSTNKVEASTSSSAQIEHAFLRLDRLVRYASAISIPGTAAQAGGSGDWYVEVQVPGNGYTSTCNQLRIDMASQQLQLRSWTLDSSQQATSAPTAFVPLADYITNGAAAAGSTAQPFQLLTPVGALSEQLQVVLTATVKAASSATSSSRFTFTALNTDLDALTNICQDQGRP